MQLIDSHCHLDYPDFDGDRAAVMARARAVGVERFLTIATKLSTFPHVHALTTTASDIFCSVGVHPHEVQHEGIPTVEALTAAAALPKVVALGETGLDYYYEGTDRLAQQESFHHHIQVRNATGLPLIIHARDAEEDILSILRAALAPAVPQVPGVIHCFTGTADFAVACLELGFYISISGIVTFKNALALQEIAASLPLERLLIETDAPYLAPVPHRGKRNEPGFVADTAAFLAQKRGISPEALGKATTENFYRVFWGVS